MSSALPFSSSDSIPSSPCRITASSKRSSNVVGGSKKKSSAPGIYIHVRSPILPLGSWSISQRSIHSTNSFSPPASWTNATSFSSSYIDAKHNFISEAISGRYICVTRAGVPIEIGGYCLPAISNASTIVSFGARTSSLTAAIAASMKLTPDITSTLRPLSWAISRMRPTEDSATNGSPGTPYTTPLLNPSSSSIAICFMAKASSTTRLAIFSYTSSNSSLSLYMLSNVSGASSEPSSKNLATAGCSLVRMKNFDEA
mmetsp:Transcript_27752/g.67510  ORF Transcript_27752/g.67510 Transcript_27752/m.67510 type:complete len:257 (+) Transcript_27752:641-1411(+)